MNGYVTFVNNNWIYVQLTNILIESVLSFSKFDIEVFSINFDFKYPSDRVRITRINIPHESYGNICYCKLYGSFNTIFDNGVQLDADMIITKDADLLFNHCIDIDQTPLGSLHPNDFYHPSIDSIMHYLGCQKRTQPYVHATYIFSNSCKPFLEECYKISQDMRKKGISPINFDETIYNVLLWKYNCTKYVDCYDPNWLIFTDRSLKDIHYKDMAVNYYICHGLKDPHVARNILNGLLKG